MAALKKAALPKMLAARWKLCYQSGMIEIQEFLRMKRGLRAEVARELGITHAAVRQWQEVPAERCWRVSEIVGIPPHILRPDVFPPPSPENQEG